MNNSYNYTNKHFYKLYAYLTDKQKADMLIIQVAKQKPFDAFQNDVQCKSFQINSNAKTGYVTNSF